MELRRCFWVEVTPCLVYRVAARSAQTSAGAGVLETTMGVAALEVACAVGGVVADIVVFALEVLEGFLGVMEFCNRDR